MAWSNNSIAVNVTTSPDAAPLHAFFPFDASQHTPKVAVEVVPTLNDAEQLLALEDAASAPPPEVALAQKVLVEIIGNKFLSESSRVRACQLILQRHDMQTEITALKLAIEELKNKKQAEFEHA